MKTDASSLLDLLRELSIDWSQKIRDSYPKNRRNHYFTPLNPFLFYNSRVRSGTGLLERRKKFDSLESMGRIKGYFEGENGVEGTFYQHYSEVVRPSIMKKGGYENLHGVPRLEKISINMGLGKRIQEKSVLEAAIDGLAAISGQKPCVTRAKKSIAGFKIREGMALGVKVTLRGVYMYEFLQRLIFIAMPRIRDFRGASSRSFDGNGNFSFGIKEYYVFPEIKYDKITDVFGMDVVIVTTAKTNEEGKLLLQEFGIPFYN